jgi:hypothetical protein
MTAWYPNHEKGAEPPTIEAFMPLPCDEKRITDEDCIKAHIEMMREVGEGGPPSR